MKLNKIFTFLKETNVFVDVKTALLKVVEKEYKELKPKLESYLNDKKSIIKEVIIDYFLSKIVLPIYLRPFKGIVRKVIDKNFDKLVDFLMSKL